MRNSERIGYGDSAKRHFLNVNKCNEIIFAGHYAEAQILFDERSAVERWKIKADLARFGGSGIEIRERNIPKIISPYEEVINTVEYAVARVKSGANGYIGTPKIRSVTVDNYQGTIMVVCNDANRIEWSMDGRLIKTKYNVTGKFVTTLNVEGLGGAGLRFRLVGDGGETYSDIFELTKTVGAARFGSRLA